MIWVTTVKPLNALAALCVLACAASASAQTPPASQTGTVSQTINATIISVRYDRPSARGRVLFGEDGVVIYDALWTPGANRATILELSRGSRVAGHDVPAGKYGVWTVPTAGEWTFILSRVWDTHHGIYPGDDEDVLRTKLAPRSAPHMEVLTFHFPVVGPYSGELHLHWGTTVLAVPIEVSR